MKIVGPQDKKEKNKSATPDVAEIRRRARANVEDGAVTEAYRADREQVCQAIERIAGDRDSLRPSI